MATLTAQDQANAEQIDYWNSQVGTRWAQLSAQMDLAMAPITTALLDVAAARPGDRVVDVGCGCGETTVALARAVGASGDVLGVDVSADMLDVARARSEGLPQARFALADAAAYAFQADRDLLASRFGVMFFARPEVAFRNLRTAAAPGGRLAFACWQPAVRNLWVTTPMQAVLPVLPPQPPADPLAPGPFAFADPDRVRAILSGSGFTQIALDPFACRFVLAESGGVEAAVAFLSKLGPTSRLLAEADADARARALDALRAALAVHEVAGRVDLAAAVWLVTARV